MLHWTVYIVVWGRLLMAPTSLPSSLPMHVKWQLVWIIILSRLIIGEEQSKIIIFHNSVTCLYNCYAKLLPADLFLAVGRGFNYAWYMNTRRVYIKTEARLFLIRAREKKTMFHFLYFSGNLVSTCVCATKWVHTRFPKYKLKVTCYNKNNDY